MVAPLLATPGEDNGKKVLTMDQFLKDGNLKMDSQEIIINNEKLNLFFFKKDGRDCIKIENKNKLACF